ncbi:hypothetical protein K432DRAFT_148747 [Lepidopterella palustris CBS 459.81]|uniref:Uncharacterized protein n=1 Tax=Lepidopterella palustris CBS 459.81 TaxID=1314670 RepID=A0A8E2JBW3_9PEZI|nr:hypothetical protein K432DRAFT_148747 [Lepidopterella palustris CBS 459.81]
MPRLPGRPGHRTGVSRTPGFRPSDQQHPRGSCGESMPRKLFSLYRPRLLVSTPFPSTTFQMKPCYLQPSLANCTPPKQPPSPSAYIR